MFDAAPAFSPSATRARPFSSVPAQGRLDALLSGPVTSFAVGAEIYAEGDKAGALYQVAFGIVRIYRLLADGRRQICAFQMPGEIFGFESDGERHFFADAVADTGLRTVRMASAADLSGELLNLALRGLSRAHDHMLTLSRLGACSRVAAFLLEMAERQESEESGVIDLPMSRADMADYLGLTIETVSRVMTKLKDAKIIRLPTYRHIDVLDWDGLREMAE